MVNGLGTNNLLFNFVKGEYLNPKHAFLNPTDYYGCFNIPKSYRKLARNIHDKVNWLLFFSKRNTNPSLLSESPVLNLLNMAGSRDGFCHSLVG